MGRKIHQRLKDTDGLKKLLKKHQGLHSFDDTRPNYATYPELCDYWTDKRIRQVFRDCRARFDDAPFVAPDRIRPFLRVFSMLVWINRLETIDHSFMKCGLTDEKFPLRDFPSDWEHTPERRELFDTIQQEQWKFFPFIFEHSRLYNQELSPRYILPIDRVEKIYTSNETIVDLIYVEPLCVIDVGVKGSQPVRLVRKQYLGEEHESAFLRERKAYEALHSYKYRSPHLVDCYGYFSQPRADGTETYNLILEYADRGSLANFYLNRNPPTNRHELLCLWKSFAGALEGLHVAHKASIQANTDEDEHKIVHQDIKPSNLLMSKKPTCIPYDFTIKLADFGYSYTYLRASIDEDGGGIKDSCGGQTYGAPENSHHERCSQDDLNVITANVDVWSLGCVLSEACVWVAFGSEGQRQYELRRTEEIDLHESLTRAGHSGCFHNGYGMLKAVAETHKQVINTLPAYDNITRRVIQMIEEYMLQSDPRKRESPYRLLELMQKHISDAAAEGDRSSSSFTTSSSHPAKPETKHVVIRGPKELMSHTSSWKANIKPDTRSADPTTQIDKPRRRLWLTYREAREYVEDRPGRKYAETRVVNTISSLKAALEKRDVIFYIENSPSMREHRIQIRETLRTYAYITKLIDDDGIEVVYASSPRYVKTHTNTTPLLQVFDKQEWRQNTFEDKLSDFIDNRIMKRLPAWWKIGPLRPKRLSIFYFTDGMWGRDESKACGVERPIEKLIDTMVRKEISRTQISIQLVRFGVDEHGERHLRALDDLGKKKDMDIVDTKPFDYDLYATLIGSVRQDMDDEGEQPATVDGDDP